MRKKLCSITKTVSAVSLALMAVFLIACATENKSVRQNFGTGKSKVLVCPVHILFNQQSTYDTIISKKIAEYLNENKYATARITQLLPPANNQWRANEAKMLSVSIDLFTNYIKANNLPENTYILYPEFLKAGREMQVIAVHYCLLNNKGEVAMRGLINSHWEEFQKVNPITDADCFEVFKNGFEVKMKK